MNAHTLRIKARAITNERKLNRIGVSNALAVDRHLAASYAKVKALLANAQMPNGKFQQRLRSILYDEMLGQTVVLIRKQLEQSAQLGWQMGVDMYAECIPRDVWVKWAQWHLGIKESELSEMMMFRWASKAINVVIDFAELLRGSELPQDSWLKRLKKIVFPPPSKEKVEEILRSDRWPDRKTWPQRLQREGFSFDAIVNQVSTSLSQGKAVSEVEKDIRPLVNNVRVRARRIARTESVRVGQAMQREAAESISDLTYGKQILSVGDERVRPEHKERHGRIYYKPGWGPPGGHDISECPETPDAPNCRCTTYDLIKGVHEIGLEHLRFNPDIVPANVRGAVTTP